MRFLATGGSRRARRWGLVVLLAFAVLAALAFGLFPQEPLRRLLEARLRAQFGPAARIGRLHLVPALLSVEIERLELTGAGFHLELPSARMTLAPGGLLRRRLALRTLELEGPSLTLQPVEPGPARDVPLPLVLVRELRVRDARVRSPLPGLGGELSLEQVSLEGGLGQGTLELRVPAGRWRRGQLSEPLSIRLRASVSPLLVGRLERLEVVAGSSRLSATGGLGRLTRIEPDLALEAELALADLTRWLGAGELRGRVSGSGRVSGTADAIAAEAQLGGADLSLAGLTVQDVELGATYRDQELKVRLSGRALGGSLAGEAGLRGTRTEGELRFKDAALQRLPRLAALGPGRASGRLGWRGELAGPLDVALRFETGLAARGVPARLEGDASGRVAPGERIVALTWRVAGELLAPTTIVEAGRLEARGTASGTWPPALAATLAGTLDLRLPAGRERAELHGRLSANAVGQRIHLDAQAAGGSLSAEAALAAGHARALELRGRWPSLARVLPGLEGEARLEAHASGPLERLLSQVDLEVDRAAFRGTPLGEIRLRLDGEGSEAQWRLSAPGLGGRATGALRTRPPRLLASLELTEAPLAPLLSGIAPGLVGVASMTAEIVVPLAAPEAASVRALVARLRLARGEHAVESVSPFTLTLEEGRVTWDGLALAGTGLALRSNGAMAGRPPALEAAHAELDLDLARLALPAELHAAGRLHGEWQLARRDGAASIDGSLAYQGVWLEGPTLPRTTLADGRLLFKDDSLVVDASAAVAEGTLALRGRVPLASALAGLRSEPDARGSAQPQLTLRWDGLSAARLFEHLRPEAATTLSGALSGRAEISGGLASLAELRVGLTTPPLTLRVQDLGLELSPLSAELLDGRLRLDEAVIASEAGTLRVSGEADLARRSLDAAARGALELRALSPFLSETSLSGKAQLDLAARGPFSGPELRGSLNLLDATLRVRELPQALTSIRGTLSFEGGELRARELTAVLGGGRLSLGGSARLGEAGLTEVQVEVLGRDMALHYPPGLRSRLDAELRLTGAWGALQLTGAVRAQRGLYDLDASLGASAAPRSTPSALRRSVALELTLDTLAPVRVRGELAQLQAQGRLTLRGDLEQPAPFGRLDLERGGKLIVQRRQFSVESGGFVYDGTWDPRLSLRARTLLQGVDLGRSYGRGDVVVEVAADGSLDSPRLTFSSTPSYSEPEILSLIATGRATSEGLTSGKWMAGEGAVGYLAGRAARTLSEELRALGFDEVTIQPELLARETDPTARFTFAKQLSERIKLLYSLSLSRTEDRFLRLELRPGRDVVLATQADDQARFAFSAGQELRLGGAPRPAAQAEERERVAQVRLEGADQQQAAALRGVLRTRPGKRASFWDVQDDAERLRAALVERGHIEAEAAGRLEGEAAVFELRPGRRFGWTVDGMSAAPDLGALVRGSLYEDEALERGRARLLEELHQRGHYRAQVAALTRVDQDERVLAFRVEPGPRLKLQQLSFPGAAALGSRELLRAAGGVARLLAEPAAAARAIEQAYHEHHYLAARVGTPIVSEGGDRLAVSVPVEEGPAARVAAVSFSGATEPHAELAALVGIEPGAPLEPRRIDAALERLRDHYLRLGHPGFRASRELLPRGSDVELAFHLNEGERVVVGSVELAGAVRAREGLLRRTLGLEPGEPLDPRMLTAAERRLLALGAFSRVAVSARGNPAVVRVELLDDARLLASYDLRWTEEQKGSALVESELRNLFGAALSVGGRYRIGTSVNEARLSAHLPALTRAGALTLSAFRLDEDLPAGDDGIANERLQRGVQLQLTRELPNRFRLLYGYNFERITTRSPFFTVPIEEDVAGLDVSLLRDTRDDVLDPRRGRFFSLSLKLAPGLVGSDFTFAKGLGQLFVTRPLRESLTWAQGYRLGLAGGFGGQRLVSSERFRAGGPTTLRGFATNSLGPRDVFGDPAGGETVLILNQELRYRTRFGLGAAVFYDAGNVFRSLDDLGLELRHSLGFGIRYASPIGLLRFDLGFPLRRGAGERAVRFFFSLGQAF